MTTRNYSNARPSTDDIDLILNLYEGRGIADWFIRNVVSSDLSEADKTEIKKNFPRANYIAWIIDRLALSMPGFEVVFQPKKEDAKEYESQNPDADPNDEDEIASKAEFENAAKAATAKSEKRAKEIAAKIRVMQERLCWEGEKDFWGSVFPWRVFLLLCGDTFVKLPWAKDLDGIAPERMGPQYSQLKLSGLRKKHIGAYRFEYPSGGSTFTNDPMGEDTIVEEISAESWKVYHTKKGDPIKGSERETMKPNAKTALAPLGLIPVSHIAFKEREDFPRGHPFIWDIMEKALHVYAIQLGRRLGNKYNSAPIIVRLNAAGKAPNFRPGETHDVNDKSPVHKANVIAVGGGLNLAASETEYKDAMHELEDAAFLPHERVDDTSQMGAPSGAASEQMSKSQVAFREGFTRIEGSLYCDIFYKMLLLEGENIERCELVCQYESMKQPTAEQTQRRADALFAEKFTRQALTEMGFEEDQIDLMLVEQEEAKNKAVDDFMLRNPAVDEFGRPIPPKNEPKPEDEPEPPNPED